MLSPLASPPTQPACMTPTRQKGRFSLRCSDSAKSKQAEQGIKMACTGRASPVWFVGVWAFFCLFFFAGEVGLKLLLSGTGNLPLSHRKAILVQSSHE